MINVIIAKGQKIDVTKERNFEEIAIGLNWKTISPEIDINASAFLLNSLGICTRDEDMIFYNQHISREQAIIHSGPENGSLEIIRISVKKIPPDIEKIALTLTIHEGETKGQSFSNVSDALCRIFNPVSGEELASFYFGEDLNKETAIVIGELYFHKGEWKFNAVGSGFNGGLTALVKNFGLEVDETAQNEAPAEIDRTPLSIPGTVTPMKLELKKKERINIHKSEKVTATLEWETKKDLDLYCFYVTKDNEVGKIYYRNLGSPHSAPYIQLDGDSLVHGKETIIIHQPEALRFVLFAAYSAIKNGFGSFKSMKVRAVVDNHQGQVVATPLHKRNSFSYWVAIAHIDFTRPNEMIVSHVEEYSRSMVERSPVLYEDGSFKMNVGIAEFK